MRFLFIFSLFSSLIFFTACNEAPAEKVSVYQENNEIIGKEREELVGEVSSTLYETTDRKNEEAEEIIQTSLERSGASFTPPAGRYWISPGFADGPPQSGRLLIYDDTDVLLIDEVIDHSFGVWSVTVDLDGSHRVSVDGIDQIQITPVETEPSTELTAGIWVVGKDINPGNYTVKADNDFAFGYLHIYEEGEMPRVFEVLNNPSESTIDVELTEGQILKITGIGFLTFHS
jgi:hypothetical protein